MTFPSWWPYPMAVRRRKRSGWCSPAKRERVYGRDGYRCVECGATDDLTLDHKVPRARGGDSSESNLQTMCRPCNQRKSDA